MLLKVNSVWLEVNGAAQKPFSLLKVSSAGTAVKQQISVVPGEELFLLFWMNPAVAALKQVLLLAVFLLSQVDSAAVVLHAWELDLVLEQLTSVVALR